MSNQPKIKLSRLRDIGWAHWDPIGLLEPGKSWSDDDCRTFADEYDSYLMQAAGQLRRGTPDREVANYLARIEVEHMGLGTPFRGALERAVQVVAAINADESLWTVPE